MPQTEICKKCSKGILPPTPICSYDNNSYHPDCLLCSLCKRTLSGKKFVKEKNDELVCEECNARTAPKCTKCKLAFAPGQSYKKLSEDTFFHNECFKCAGPCQKPIGAEFYEVDNNKFLCTDCYDKYGNDYDKHLPKANDYASKIEPQKDVGAVNNLVANLSLNKPAPSPKENTVTTSVEILPAIQRDRNAPQPSTQPLASVGAPSSKPAASSSSDASDKCATCGQKLSGTISVYEDKKYHAKCFVCSKCKEEFKEKTFFKLDGAPCCRTCHSKSLVESAAKCQKCAQPILDTIVTFKNAKYHDYCLVCTQCSEKLVGKSIYTDKRENPYCVSCFTIKEGKTCAKCLKIITPDQTNLVFESKNFHKECFKCNQCSKQISSNESFYKTGDSVDSVICSSCA